jgi:Cu+-exporting ATPase
VYLDSGKSTASSKGISTSQVNFPEKGSNHLQSEVVSIKTIVYLLSSIGYEPYISLENYETEVKVGSLTYKLGVFFFVWNIMLLSFQNILM